MAALQDLIHRHLSSVPVDGPTNVKVGPEAAAWGSEACAFSGSGLDLYRAEHVLAAVRFHIQPRGTLHLAVLALTNTRLVLGGYASVKNERNALAATVGYEHMSAVKFEKSFFKGATLEVYGPSGMVSLIEVYRDALGEFFRALGALPPGTRAEPGMDAVRPTSADPSGAAAARGEMWAADPAIESTLHRIALATQRGELEAGQALDLVGRAVIAHRAPLQGPAGFGDGFAAAATGAEFPALLAELLGPPIGYQQGPNGALYIDFGVPQSQGLPHALTALGLASFVGLGVGFSPGGVLARELLAKPPLRSIRVLARDSSGGTYYALFDGGTGQPLHTTEGIWAHGIHQTLAHHGRTALLRRVSQIASEEPS